MDRDDFSDDGGTILPAATLGRRTADASARFLASLLDRIDYAFQPIVNIRSGTCYGYEALLRGAETIGFQSIQQLFDHAYTEKLLHKADILLREKAIAKFAQLPRSADSKLFFNLDPRLLESPDYQPNQTLPIIERHGIDPRSICFELTERHDTSSIADSMRMLQTYRTQSYLFAIDDFGTGFSGLKLLYDYQPDKVKIDRFFITGIERDPKKKLFVSTIVDLAHVLGIIVIAEGVETEAELITCREIGCDLAQGYFIARPTTDLSQISDRYDHVAQITLRDRRASRNEHAGDQQAMEFIQPLTIDTGMKEVFEAFRLNKPRTFFPVTDRQGQPVGIVREETLRDYIYPPHGRRLIHNKAHAKALKDFITPCPVADSRDDTSRILEIFAHAENAEGVLIVSDQRYVGFLSTISLLRLINEKNVASARDRNPLTRLRGNNSIHAYVATAVTDPDLAVTLVYFDFDNFKPFNDIYGFRQGDRAILLFAELLQKHFANRAGLIGHVGGDDFFLALENVAPETAVGQVKELCRTFAEDIASFYDAEARAKGYIDAIGKDGLPHRYRLMTCSAALLHVPAGRRPCSPDTMMDSVARLKKQAKAARDGMAIEHLSASS